MSSRLSRYSFLAACAAMLLVSACDTETPAKKPVNVAAGTQGYLQNLVLAHWALEQSPDDVNAGKTYLVKLNGYATQKNVKPITTTAVMLAFKTDDDGKSYKLLVPVVAPAGRVGDLSNLRQVTHLLTPHKPEYRSIHVKLVTLTTREAVRMKSSDTPAKVNDLYETVVESAATPPRLDAARLQIALTKFFLHENIRDAAYVSLEAAKEALASADTSAQVDADEVQALSKELENLENTLHKKLPYTF